mgnify:FL=1
MTSEWISADLVPQKKRVYDKDFKRLNKIATKAKATTCQDQYAMRQTIGNQVRIKDPNYSMMKQHHQKHSSHGVKAEWFGKPNRPSTPIKDVVNEQYARVAEQRQAIKNHMNEESFRSSNKFRGARSHTKASYMAKEHLNTTRTSLNQSGDLFKMSQFKDVTSRVGKHHQNNNRGSSVRV